MPLLFSYGTLQEASVQLSTFGRRLNGQKDALKGFELGEVTIGERRFANVITRANSHVPGTVFAIADSELAAVDAYEAQFSYVRVEAPLASGRRAWVYLHRP